MPPKSAIHSDLETFQTRPRGTGVRVFLAERIAHTAFADDNSLHAILAEYITFVDDPSEADIILSSRERSLRRYGSYDKIFVVWTHEPRFNYQTESIISISGIRNSVYIMNAYTGGIYADKFYYFCSRDLDFDKTMRTFVDKPRRAVMLATYRPPPTPVIFDGRNIDLQEYRQEVATHLLRRGFCDIYGRNWPSDYRIVGDSRGDGWGEAKRQILKRYAVNIAFENTIIPNYVTEKLWDAVVNACLPVYHGVNNEIYEIFPSDSFLEANSKSVECLVDEIINMPTDEMETRYAACLRAYINVFAPNRRRISRHACLVRTIRFYIQY